MSHPNTPRALVATLISVWSLAGAIAFLFWTGNERLARIDQRLESLETDTVGEETLKTALRGELDGVHSDLAAIQQQIALARSEAAEARELAQRLTETQGDLTELGRAMEAQGTDLAVLREAQASFGPETLTEALDERDERLARRWEALNELVASTLQKADESQRRIELLDEEIEAERDLSTMWKELVGPVVQLAGETSVGSGVLLRSRHDQERGLYRTYLLTAWHVVRDIQGDLSQVDVPVPTAIYLEDGTIQTELATLLCFDAELDAALLEIETPEEIPNGAEVASREDVASIRIFDEICAVGCPLGNDPIPTRGEVATRRHKVDGENYWMINAPTYIGNSGGGIFHSETHELLGIFSKIYTHGSLRPTIVPHMGLVTPLDRIYDWLAEVGHGEVELASGRAHDTVASRSE